MTALLATSWSHVVLTWDFVARAGLTQHRVVGVVDSHRTLVLCFGENV